MEENYKTLSFVAPSGYEYTIREENGEDEEILSNTADVRGLMNITKFIASIVTATNFTKSGKLTIQDALEVPMLDRQLILIKNRIFSLGKDVPFTYQWPNSNKVAYEQDLNELIYDDYTVEPSEEEVEVKEGALPLYPNRELLTEHHFKDIPIILSSGKELLFDILNGEAEKLSVKLMDQSNRNTDFYLRNLRLKVDDKYIVVQNFKKFSIKEMAELRAYITELDPVWPGTTKIENPSTGETLDYPIMASPRFFFLTEA